MNYNEMKGRIHFLSHTGHISSAQRPLYWTAQTMSITRKQKDRAVLKGCQCQAQSLALLLGLGELGRGLSSTKGGPALWVWDLPFG